MCPTGVATQDRHRQKALVVEDKLHRVANFHQATLRALGELTAAAGLVHPNEFRPVHISHRLSPSEVATFADLYPCLRGRELVDGTNNPRWRPAWDMASAKSFRAVA